MNLENSLLKSQYLLTVADNAKTRGIHYQEGICPLTHTQKSYAACSIAIDVITAKVFAKNLEDPGGMHSNATKHVFRDLEGMGGD
jgi:hypothetical protein